MVYQTGSAIEVDGQREPGCTGGWFPATVQTVQQHKLDIEFDHIQEHGSHVKDCVKKLDVRPKPPLPPYESFEDIVPGMVVDHLVENLWWLAIVLWTTRDDAGTITEVGCVYPKTAGELPQVATDPACLRPAIEWVAKASEWRSIFSVYKLKLFQTEFESQAKKRRLPKATVSCVPIDFDAAVNKGGATTPGKTEGHKRKLHGVAAGERKRPKGGENSGVAGLASFRQSDSGRSDSCGAPKAADPPAALDRQDHSSALQGGPSPPSQPPSYAPDVVPAPMPSHPQIEPRPAAMSHAGQEDIGAMGGNGVTLLDHAHNHAQLPERSADSKAHAGPAPDAAGVAESQHPQLQRPGLSAADAPGSVPETVPSYPNFRLCGDPPAWALYHDDRAYYVVMVLPGVEPQNCWTQVTGDGVLEVAWSMTGPEGHWAEMNSLRLPEKFEIVNHIGDLLQPKEHQLRVGRESQPPNDQQGDLTHRTCIPLPVHLYGNVHTTVPPPGTGKVPRASLRLGMYKAKIYKLSAGEHD